MACYRGWDGYRGWGGWVAEGGLYVASAGTQAGSSAVSSVMHLSIVGPTIPPWGSVWGRVGI